MADDASAGPAPVVNGSDGTAPPAALDGSDPAVQAKARAQGWRPREQWDGSPERWVDAAAYLKRGEEVLPYLRANNQRLQAELERERREREALARDLQGAKEAIDTLQSFRGEVEERIEATDEAALARQLATARENGDTAAEIRVLRELRKLDAAAEPPAAKPAPPAPPPAPAPQRSWQETPEGSAWLANNAWFNEDRRMRAMFVEIGQELAEQGALSGLTPAQRLAKVGEETLRFFGRQAPAASAARVESGRPSAATSVAEGEHSFTDLPQDARDECARQVKFLVGPGKRFKDEAAWRKYYVEAYYKDWGGELRNAQGQR